DVRTLSRTLRDGSAPVPPQQPVAAQPPRRVRLSAAAIAVGALALVLGAAGFSWFHVSHPVDTGSHASADLTSLAVLPLVNNSGNAEKEYVADGITESLIRSLSQLPKLTVLSRNTAFKFKGQTAN